MGGGAGLKNKKAVGLYPNPILSVSACIVI